MNDNNKLEKAMENLLLISFERFPIEEYNLYPLYKSYSKRATVVYVIPFTSFIDSFKKIIKLILEKRVLKQFSDNLFIYNSLALLPFGRILKLKIITRINNIVSILLLRHAIKTFKRKNTVVNFNLPCWHWLKGFFDESLFVYHILDENVDFPGTLEQRKFNAIAEKEALKKSSCVFTVSKTLYKKAKSSNNNTFYMPNGVDFIHFNKATLLETNTPEDLNKIKKPIIGMIGKINEKLDLECIKHIAVTRPKWSIVLIGPINSHHQETTTRINSLISKTENLFHLGNKKYSALPNYLKGIDVCLLPHPLNKYTEAISPLKFYQYLSAGKPIVSSPLPELVELSSIIYISNTKEEFVKNIEKALKENDSKIRNQRIHLAEESSWDNRSEQMLNCMIEQIRKIKC